MKSFIKQLWWALLNKKWCLKCHQMTIHGDSLGTDYCWKCGHNRKIEKMMDDKLRESI